MDLPLSDNKIIGQEKSISVLTRYISSNSVPPALLFVGERGVGKMKVALEFARAINCEVEANRHIGASCVCQSCSLVKSGSHPSVIIVDENYQRAILSDGKDSSDKETTGIDTVRAVQKALALKITHGRRTVVIVDSAQNLTREAADAFLKTLEEPSSNATLILLVPSARTLPRTIISRCQKVFFRRLKADEIISVIKKIRPDITNFPDDMVKIFSATGSVGRSLDIIDNYENYNALKIKFRRMEISGKSDFKSDSAAAAFIEYLSVATREDFLSDPDGKLYLREALLDAMRMLSSGVNRNMVLARLHAKIYIQNKE